MRKSHLALLTRVLDETSARYQRRIESEVAFVVNASQKKLRFSEW